MFKMLRSNGSKGQLDKWCKSGDPRLKFMQIFQFSFFGELFS